MLFGNVNFYTTMDINREILLQNILMHLEMQFSKLMLQMFMQQQASLLSLIEVNQRKYFHLQ